MIKEQDKSSFRINFRLNDKMIQDFLNNSPYDKQSTVKYIIRIALINNKNIIKTFEDEREEEDKIQNNKNHIYIAFGKEDTDLIELLNNYKSSRQALIKRLMRIALINDKELIQKSGLIPLDKLNKNIISKDNNSDSNESNVKPNNNKGSINKKTKHKFGNLGKNF